jgi:DNA-binding NarL/FixJ family response regulator
VDGPAVDGAGSVPASAPPPMPVGEERGSIRDVTAAADPEGAVEHLRVLVADDHDLYRRGMQVVIGLEDDIEIVGEARNGEEVVALAIELAPDVVLMDVRMPVLDGIAACSKIKAAVPATKILMLTMSDDEGDLFEALRAGASGYLLKDQPAEEVATALRAVQAGHSMIPPSLAAQLIAEFGRISRKAHAAPVGPHLTDRELEVLRLVARGCANKEIAKELFISENTVKNHVRNILEKLQLHSRVEAAMYAMRSNLLEVDD